tara:strand:- start:76737 stop:77024 length:288 start_codon:yes stop_codon:yes gene_type:complete
MFNQFDVVQLSTTKGIRFLSGPQGGATDPHGNWSIIGFVELDAIIAKDTTIVRVPVADLKKVASYNLDSFMSKIQNAGYLKDRKNNDHGKKESSE